MFRRWIVRIHRPARESSDLRNVSRMRDRCIFYSTWVKRVCCVSKISSDCGCQSKEIGVGMEVRLLSVGTRGFFFLAALRLAIAASALNSVAPNEKKFSGTRVYYVWPRGPMEKASDYESGNSRFESWRGRLFFLKIKETLLGSDKTSIWKKNGTIKRSLTKILKKCFSF